jgi:hypothetical protein
VWLSADRLWSLARSAIAFWQIDCISGVGWVSNMGRLFSHRFFGDIVVTCFIVVQFLDWVATFQGITLFGLAIERNSLLRFLMERYDIILVLTVAKLSATIGGSVLHFIERHAIVALLTLFYIVFAIFPWFKLLVSYPVF